LKLLLLGAGESGKSTLFKQMTTIYGRGFSENERKNKYKKICIDNVMTCIRALLRASERFTPPTARAQTALKALDEVKEEDDSVLLTAELARAITVIWQDPGIQATYAKRSAYQLNDSCKYFLDKVEQLADEEYVPSEEDVMRSRVRTTGIVQKEFVIQNNRFHMYDVGGQRNERKKWIHCFDNVTAVIFVAALSEYDQVLEEDETVNRMMEALKLFDVVCNNRHFMRTAMILFLNKRDLFEDKIKTVPLSHCFADYKGENVYDEALAFVQNEFESRNKSPEKRRIYTHVTCATDKNNVQVVFEAVKDIVIRQSLIDAGLGD